VPHHDAARVAGQAPRSFRGNVCTVFEDRLAGLIGIRKGRGIDVDDHLVALSRGAGIDSVVKGCLCEQRQGVGLLLGHGRRFRGNVRRGDVRVVSVSLLIQSLASGGERLHEYRADLGSQPPSESHHAVLVLIHVQRAARVPSGGLGRLGLAVHAAPATDDAFDVIGRAGAPHGQQTFFRLRRGHAGQGPDLGVRELAPRQGLGHPRQRSEDPRHPDAFAGRPRVEPYPPAQPGGAGAKAGVPTLAGVELADEIEEAGGRGVEVGRELGDLIPQAVQCERVHGESPFYTGDSTPRFRSDLRGTSSGDRGPTDIFSANAPALTSPRFCGPLRRPPRGTADTRRAPTPKAVKRKIARDTPSRMIIDYEDDH
jgi:hypothetical protein